MWPCWWGSSSAATVGLSSSDSHGCILVSWMGKRQGSLNMPTISQFFGILIRMFFDDHPPLKIALLE